MFGRKPKRRDILASRGASIACRNCLMRCWLVIACCAVAGCSTPYQEMGFTGGVSAQQMTADTYRIISRGNAYTGSTTIQDYTLLKAAETTKLAGATHFLIISAADASRSGAIVSPGQATTTFYGNTASTTYSPATVHNFIKPGQDTYIRVITVAPGQAPPNGAFLADEIIQFVGSRVSRG
jgi:hypothetical protein